MSGNFEPSQAVFELSTLRELRLLNAFIVKEKKCWLRFALIGPSHKVSREVYLLLISDISSCG